MYVKNKPWIFRWEEGERKSKILFYLYL